MVPSNWSDGVTTSAISSSDGTNGVGYRSITLDESNVMQQARAYEDMRRVLTEREAERMNQSLEQMYSPTFTWEHGINVAKNASKPKKHQKSELTPEIIQQSFKKVIAEISKIEKNKIKSLHKEIDNYGQQIKNIEKDIKKKTVDIKKIIPFNKSKKIKSIEEDFKKIRSNPKISGIYAYGNSILIETNDLYVSNFLKNKDMIIKRKTKGPKLLGKFSIRLFFEPTKVLMSVDNMTFISDVYDLPTIQSGKCCWGNIAGDIRKDLSQLNIEEFVNDMIAYIESPSNQAAYISWDRYFKDQKKIKKFVPREPIQEIYINLPTPLAQQEGGLAQWIAATTSIYNANTNNSFISGIDIMTREESLEELENNLVSAYVRRLESLISVRETDNIRRIFTDAGIIFISSFF